MRGAVPYGPRDVRFVERDSPTILKPTDAIIRIAVACVCEAEYRGARQREKPRKRLNAYEVMI
jgi:threonine dehydrogenase-like Zn-dependent dehydrogenase